MMPRWSSLLLSEFIGTFALVLVGTAAIALFMGEPAVVSAIPQHFLRLCLVLLCFGLIIAAVVHSPAGRLSGAHINPAVSIAFAARGELSAHHLPLYLTGQCAGAVAAAAATAWLLPEQSAVTNYSMTLPSASHPLWLALAAELAGSCLLMLLILACLRHGFWQRRIGWAAGAFVAVYGTAVAHLSGSSFNPARSLGPAVIAGDYSQLWIYLLCPVVGAIAAVRLYRLRALTALRAS